MAWCIMEMDGSDLPVLKTGPPLEAVQDLAGQSDRQQTVQIDFAEVRRATCPQGFDPLDLQALDQQVAHPPVRQPVLHGVLELLHQAGPDVVQRAGHERTDCSREQQRNVWHEPELSELRVEVLVGPVVRDRQGRVDGHAAEHVGPDALPEFSGALERVEAGGEAGIVAAPFRVNLCVQDLADHDQLEWRGEEGGHPAREGRESGLLAHGEVVGDLGWLGGLISSKVDGVADSEVGQAGREMSLKPLENDLGAAQLVHLPVDAVRVVAPVLRSLVADTYALVAVVDDGLDELEGVGQVGGQCGGHGGQAHNVQVVGLPVSLVRVVHIIIDTQPSRSACSLASLSYWLVYHPSIPFRLSTSLSSWYRWLWYSSPSVWASFSLRSPIAYENEKFWMSLSWLTSMVSSEFMRSSSTMRSWQRDSIILLSKALLSWSSLRVLVTDLADSTLESSTAGLLQHSRACPTKCFISLSLMLRVQTSLKFYSLRSQHQNSDRDSPSSSSLMRFSMGLILLTCSLTLSCSTCSASICSLFCRSASRWLLK